MTLQDLISSNGNLFLACQAADDSNDWASAVAFLNNKNIEVTDDTLRSARWVMVTFTDVVDTESELTEADVILGTLQAATVPRVIAEYDSMSGGDGIDLSDDQVQQLLPYLGSQGNWPVGLVERLQEFGIWQESLADQHLTDEPTEQAVQDAWTAHRNRYNKRVKEGAIDTAQLAARQAIKATPSMTEVELVTVFSDAYAAELVLNPEI